MAKIDLSIVILNFNTRGLLRDCLSSLKKTEKDGYSWEVFVVDNASMDGSSEMVKREFPEVELIENKKNIGFAAGNNLAVARAKGRYLLFLNPDTIVFPETLKETVSFMKENKSVGAVTCRVELADGTLDEAAHRGFPTPWNAFCHFSGLEKIFPKARLFSGYKMGWADMEKIHEIDALAGAFMLVMRKAGNAAGWWDEDYFWYGEDLDFCFRLKERGWKIIYFPKVKIVHYKGAASGIKKHSHSVSKATRETRRMAAKASVEAMRIFNRKHYLDKYPSWIMRLVFAGIWLLEKFRLLFW